MSEDTEPKPKKTTWGLIVITIVMCAGVFGFIYKYMEDSYNNRLDLKNDTIDMLERENKRLAEEGRVPEAVKRLEGQIEELRSQLRPLTLVTKIDQITGRCKIGMMSFGTELTTDFAAAQKLIDEKKYDLALAKADEMEAKLPDFVGSVYLRFKVQRAKGYDEDAALLGKSLISKLPQDTRIMEVHLFLMNYLLHKGEKKEAEQFCLKSLALWPKDEELLESFKRVFGYEPAIGKAKD